MITSNAYWKAMKKTLDGITTEDLSKEQVCFGKNKLFEMESMEDGYSDYVEVSGTTLLVEKDEGKTMAVDPGIIMGGTKRLIPRTMAKKVIISEEAMEDLKRILEGRSAFYSKADLAFNTSAYRLEDCFATLRAQVRRELARV